jgi:hypothetical protein
MADEKMNDATNPAVAASEPRNPNLPEGVTDEMIAEWKSKYQKVSMNRIGGRRFIYRSVTRGEYSRLIENARSDEALGEALIAAAVLYREPADFEPAGLKVGLSAAIATLSGVDQGIGHYVDEDVKDRWTQIVAAYPEHRRIDLEQFTQEHKALWALLCEDQIFLLQPIKRVDYERIIGSESPDVEERLVQQGMVYPAMSTADLRELPYGIYMMIDRQLMIASGFQSEPSILL